MEESERGRVLTDEGIGCETMRCDAGGGSIQCKDVDEKGGKVLTNFLAGEEEQPLEGEFNFDLDLLFNTGDHTLLRPDRRHHTGVCENIVI